MSNTQFKKMNKNNKIKQNPMQLKQFLLVFLLIFSGSLFSQEPEAPEPGEDPITYVCGFD